VFNQIRKERHLTKQEQDDALWACYQDGMTDSTIAAEVGVAVGRVINWRRSNQLPANIRRVDDEFNDYDLPESKDTEGEGAGSVVGGSGTAAAAAG
jgi:hypothetical protein